MRDYLGAGVQDRIGSALRTLAHLLVVGGSENSIVCHIDRY